MPTGTDRGIAVVTRSADGRRTVLVCSDVRGGKPVDVFAMHVGPPSVVIDPAVRLVSAGAVSHTLTMVQVRTDETGAVHIQVPSEIGGLAE
jgi:hypothetical protein